MDAFFTMRESGVIKAISLNIDRDRVCNTYGISKLYLTTVSIPTGNDGLAYLTA